MSKTIGKYPITLSHTQHIDIPIGAIFLTMQLQHNHPTIWALVDSSAPIVRRRIHVAMTGDDTSHIIGPFQYLGTCQPRSGLVFHIFVF